MRKIKMIWDFRGPDALKIAEHHEKHLKEYIATHKILIDITGFEALSNLHAVAFMVVEEKDVNPIRSDLKPNRGQVYESK
ncbi:hypothetical protein ACS386_07355 [Flavobacteriaceae bacterium LMO-SS05]